MTETRDAQGTARAAVIALLPLALAAVATHLAAQLDGTAFETVRLVPPEVTSAKRSALAWAVLMLGTFAVFFAPGLLVMRALALRTASPVGNAFAALLLSLVSVSIAWIAAQAATDGIAGRSCFYLTVAVLDTAALVAGVALAPGAPALPALPALQRGSGRRELLVPILGAVLLVVAAAAFMPGKIALESLDGDATRIHSLAASLFESAFPEWNLESGGWGFYPTAMFAGYPAFFSMALLGDSEAALRLVALLFLAAVVVTGADLAGRGQTRASGASLNVLVPMLAVGYLSIQVGAYYAGAHPFHADLAGRALQEWLVAALATGALLLLRDGASGLAAVAALLAILSSPSGLLYAGLLAAAGWASHAAENRQAIARGAFALIALILIYAVLLVIYTVTTGIFDAMIGEWWRKYFAGRAQLPAGFGDALEAAGWWTLLVGGLPALGMIAGLFDRDRTTRWLALVGVAWVAAFALSPSRDIHELLPVALLPMVVSLRIFAGRAGRAANLAVPAALTLSAAGSIALCHPEPAPAYIADREFGRRTLFLAGTERVAVDFSHVLHARMGAIRDWRAGAPWTLARHTWVTYADRGFEPRPEHEFFVGQGPAPVPGLQEIARIPGPDGREVVWWGRDAGAVEEWRRKAYPRRIDASRFHFEMRRSARGEPTVASE